MRDHQFQLFDSACALIVCTDLAGRIQYWNRACSELTGYTLDEAIGRTIQDLLVAHDTLVQTEAGVEKPRDSLIKRSSANYWITKDGGRRWIEWSSALSKDETTESQIIITTGIDRTEEKRTEVALKYSETTVSEILDIAADAIISVDAEQTIVIYNKGAENIFGWPRNEVIGQPLDLLIPEPFSDANHAQVHDLKRSFSTAKSTEKRRFNISCRRKNGMEFPAEAAISRLQAEPGPLLTMTLRDISNQKALEDDLPEEIQTLDSFTRTIVNDLRNPLKLIAQQTQLLKIAERLPVVKPLSAKLLESISRAAAHMTQSLDDLIDAAGIDEKTVSVNKKPIRLRALIEDSVASIYPAASVKNIEVVTEVRPPSASINADSARLVQAIGSILSNAVKYSPAGAKLKLSVAEKRCSVYFRTTDSGPGVPQNSNEQLLESTWQPDSDDQGGAAVDLGIAKDIIEAHGGRIWIEQVENSGATLMFNLPKE